MSIVADVIGLAASGGWSAVTGGLFGVVSTGVKAYTDYKNKQLELETQKQKWAHDERMVDKTIEMEKYTKDMEKDVEGIHAERDVAVSDNVLRRQAATLADQRLGSAAPAPTGFFGGILGFLYGIADFVTKMIRPTLTLAAAWTFWDIMQWARSLTVNAQLEAHQAFALAMEVQTSATFLSINIITFWFGMRAVQAPSEKLFGAWLAKKK